MSFGIMNYERDRGNLPYMPVVNMFVEKIEIEPTGVSLQSRSGIQNSAVTMGAGPIRQLFQVDGVLNNGLFGLSDINLYNSGTLIGATDGNGAVSMDGYENNLFICAGERLWSYNGSALTATYLPTGGRALKVVVGASRAIVIEKDTQKFFFSNPLSTTIGALSFSSAENSPDRLRDAIYLGDTLILFGANTVEFWPVTQDANAPFLPLKGRVFQKGIRGTGMVAKINDTFAWVTEDNEVCLGTPDAVISEMGLSKRIADSLTVKTWTFFLDSTEMLCISLDDEDNIFNPATGSWTVFTSTGYANWLPKYYVNGYFGSGVTGQLYSWATTFSDFGGSLERRFRAWLPLNSGTTVVNNLILRCNPGHTPFLTGDYIDPIVEMRTSSDGGFTFRNWRQRNMGAQGHYFKQVFWNSLGGFSFPGALVEFRMTDPAPFRVSNVLANEPYGGLNGV